MVSEPTSKGTIFIHTYHQLLGWLEERVTLFLVVSGATYPKRLGRWWSCAYRVHNKHAYDPRVDLKPQDLFPLRLGGHHICTPTNGFFRSMPVKIDTSVRQARCSTKSPSVISAHVLRDSFLNSSSPISGIW